jgi:hypothetical protein
MAFPSVVSQICFGFLVFKIRAELQAAVEKTRRSWSRTNVVLELGGTKRFVLRFRMPFGRRPVNLLRRTHPSAASTEVVSN